MFTLNKASYFRRGLYLENIEDHGFVLIAQVKEQAINIKQNNSNFNQCIGCFRYYRTISLLHISTSRCFNTALL